MNSDFKELLNTFNEHEVKYLIVGGHAGRPQNPDNPEKWAGQPPIAVPARTGGGRPTIFLRLVVMRSGN